MFAATSKKRSSPASTPSSKRQKTTQITPGNSLSGGVTNQRITFGDDDEDDAPFYTAQPETRFKDVQADSEAESSDEDEAPEAISTTAAREATKTDTAKVAAAVRAEKTKQTEKRKQSAAARKNDKPKKTKALITKDAEISGDEDMEDADGLPLLLPDSLLATEAPERPPTVSPEPEALAQIPQGRRTNLEDIQPPEKERLRDRRVGPVSVRVLEKTNANLAPRRRNGTAAIHQALLSGRDTQAQKMGKRRRGAPGAMQRKGLLKPPAFV